MKRNRACIAGLVFSCLVAGCTTPRPPAPPAGVLVVPPLGAIDVDELHMEEESVFEQSIEQSFRDEGTRTFDADGDGTRDYAMLALSGGGSAGAFGAGLLCGWSSAGTRPDFKVVTGVSTGSLQATFAFLGPEYDDALREVYTAVETSDIYQKRQGLSALFSDALNDTEPLMEMLERYVTDEMLAAVARKHARGYRLFVGTVNFDTAEFIIWDLGAIASSEDPGAADHYRRVLLASASIPVFFPPVYFEVEAGGKTYYEMHVDGGTYANVFFRNFMLDLDDAIEDLGPNQPKRQLTVYLIQNGIVDEEDASRDVPGSTISIAATTIEDIFAVSGTSSLFRVYVLARRNDIGFKLAAIPLEFGRELEPTVFDPETMQALFDFAYDKARNGYEWMDAPPYLDPDEQFE